MNAVLNDIVTDARKAINESGANEAEFFTGSDEDELDALIESKVTEAVDWVHSSAALEVMSGDAFTHESVPSTGTKSVDVADMIRFIQGKGNDWRNAVRELTEEGTMEYAIATDEYVGASIDRPAVLLEYVNGGRTLSLLPEGQAQEGSLGSVVYIDKAAITTSDDVSSVPIDSNLYAAMVEYLAGLVLMVLNDNRGENMIQLAKSMIGMDINKNGQG